LAGSDNAAMIRGVIFDLDGTLADSQLDFDAMRREMELPSGLPILETVAGLSTADAARCQEILHRHELEGVERATLLPGAGELLSILKTRGMHLAIATRNSRRITQATLSKLSLAIELLLTRDDGPVKPDPWPVRHACDVWQVQPREVVMVGDYRFDIDCGKSAGARTVLLNCGDAERAGLRHCQPDLVLDSLTEYPRLLDWLDSIP
jgi:HAD superfamily hydrolase (TIGR01509 family)